MSATPACVSRDRSPLRCDGRDASSGLGAPLYVRHRPERTLLYALVQEYYPALKAHLAAQGKAFAGVCRAGVRGLPQVRPARGGFPTGALRDLSRLSYEVIVMLFRRVAQRLHDRLADGALLWCGRRVKIVDGSTVSMPDTAANQARFPQQSGQKAGLGFPIARLVAIFCWASGAILEVATCPFQGKENSELALFRGLLGTLSPKEVVLGDRFYASYFMLALLQHQDVDAIFRQHQARKVDFRRGRRLGRGEHVVVWHKPKRPAWMDQETYDQLPSTLTLREIRIGRLVLVTTLLDTALFTREAIGAL